MVRRGLEWPDLFRHVFDAEEAGWLRIEEFQDGNDVIVRAELPGIDPDKDVELTISDGVLHIAAHREAKSEEKHQGGFRSEFRYGSFTRSFILPPGVDEGSVMAKYADGVLEVRIPVGSAKESTTKVPISKT
jgi:HSP20 family protein